MQAKPIFSVIIPAFNEVKAIGECLSALANQSLPRKFFEVIVVDNGSTDETAGSAATFQDLLHLRVLFTTEPCISGVRNFGASFATGRFFAFLDADCVVPSHWLEAAAELLAADSARVIGAHYIIPPNSSWLAKAWYGDMSTRKSGPVSYVPSGDLFVSRENFFKIDGFDPEIATSEDTDFCKRASDVGLPTVAVTRLGVVHFGTPQSLGSFYRKQRWHGTHVHRVFWKDIRGSRATKSVVFAGYTLLAVAAGVGIAFHGVISGRLLEVLLAPVLLLIAPFLMAIRRSRSGVGPLTLLYLVYGLARGVALLGAGVSTKEDYHLVSGGDPKSDVGSALH